MFDNPVFDPCRVLNPEIAPESQWAMCVADEDRQGAVDAFIDMIRHGGRRTCWEYDVPHLYETWFGRRIGYQGGFHLDPDQVVERHYVGACGIEHRFEGDIDWWFDPTKDWGEKGTHQWSTQFNRHYQWVPLASRYEQTHDAKYARAWEYELLSWIDQSPRPDIIDNRIIPHPWRTIEMGIRMSWTWPHAFEIFRKSSHIGNETLWKMICLFREHGIGLLETPTSANFKAMESNGLAHVGFMFPELRGSQAFFSTALDRTIAEIDRQFYPDGSQIELSPSYACVSITNLFSALKVAQHYHSQFGIPRGLEITRRVWEQFAETIYVLGRLAAPNGITPNMHDSEHVKVPVIFEYFREHLDEQKFSQKPWEREGADHIPWGGYGIIRRQGRYAMLDVGPYGAGHQHKDALQVVTWADDDWLCIDAGKPVYDFSQMTKHIRSSASHNVVQMDGLQHFPDPLLLRVDDPLDIQMQACAACATRRFVDHPEEASTSFEQTRHLVDVKDIGWLIIDLLLPGDDQTHWWELLWHLNVNELAIDGDSAVGSRDQKPLLHIHVSSSSPVALANVQGQLEPQIRGWQGDGASDPAPVPTLQVKTQAQAERVWVCTLLSLGRPARAQMQIDAADRIDVAVDDQSLRF